MTGVATLRNVTIAGNTATSTGGGVGSNNAGNPTLTSVLLSGNTHGGAENCGTANGAVITSGGNNLSDDNTCAAFVQAGDLPGTLAGIGALADNGGPTMTHALQTGSAAINAGKAAGCPTTDQRGYSRSGACDIGAFEFGGTAPAGRSFGAARATAIQRPLPTRLPQPAAPGVPPGGVIEPGTVRVR